MRKSLKKPRKKILLMAAWAGFALSELRAQENIQVQVGVDPQSAGSAYKAADDVVFSAAQDDCRIEWRVEQAKSGERSLQVQRACAMPFSRQLDLHRAILREINKKWPLAEFKSLAWGSLCPRDGADGKLLAQPDWSWCLPVAKASLESKDFIRYWKRYPQESNAKGPNAIFVELANRTQSYRDLAGLFSEFGARLSLSSVEKVFSARVKQAPFYDQIKDWPIQGNPSVMYDAGMNDFEIHPLK